MKNIIKTTCSLLLLVLSVHWKAQPLQLSLKEAVSLAKSGNAEMNYQTLEGKRLEEATRENQSYLRPSVSFNGSYLHYFQRQVIFLPGYFAGSEKPVQDLYVGGKETYYASLNLSQPFLFESARHHKISSKIAEKIQVAKLDEFEDKLITTVAKLYYEIQLLNQELGFHSAALKRQKEIFQISKSLYLQGLGLKTDTLTAFIEVQNRESAVSQVMYRISASKRNFLRLLGLQPEKDFNLTDSLNLKEKLLLFDKKPSGENIQHKIKIQQLSLAKEKETLASLKSERIPQGMFVANYLIQSQSDNHRFKDYSWPSTSFVGIQLSVPILTGGKISARVNQSKIKIQQEKLLLEDMKLKLQSETQSLTDALNDANYHFLIQKNNLRASETGYNMVLERYRNGFASHAEMTDSELILKESELKYISSIFDIIITNLELEVLSGTLRSNFSK